MKGSGKKSTFAQTVLCSHHTKSQCTRRVQVLRTIAQERWNGSTCLISPGYAAVSNHAIVATCILIGHGARQSKVRICASL